MTNLKDYLSGVKYIRLDSVKYTNYDEEVQNPPRMNCIDDYKCQYKEGVIEIMVTRHVDFSPACLFSAEISYVVIHKFDESKCVDFNIEEYDLYETVKKDIDYYIPDEMDRVSLILSQITDAFEGRPIVTSPCFLFKDDV